MAFQMKFFLLIFLYVQNFLCIKCFHVDFQYLNKIKIEENVESTINKRDMTQFFDQASYAFNGFEKVESVPVMFPLDICLMKLESAKYAAALHKNSNGEISLEIFRENEGAYKSLLDITMPNGIAMDCKSFGTKGYLAVARNITESIRNAREGSPIYEISQDRIRPVQYFPAENLRNVFLRASGNDLFLLQAFENSKSNPNLICPYYKWSGTTFNKLGGGIPCSNARNLEPFSIDYESYVAVANYADQSGRTNIKSEIYKFNRQSQKFQLFQKIKTNGAVDVRYFRVPMDAVRQKHFLIFGNSKSSRSTEKPGDNLEADSIFYVFEKGQFIPYQSISLYAVEKFLPIENLDAEKFLLLVACANQDIKIYNLNDWKFEVSNVQYTEGALGRGVAEMRIFDENDNNYLVIANENMADNETNIFLPIFKQEEHANALRQEIINWAKENIERLNSIDVNKLKNNVEEKLLKLKGKPLEEIRDIPKANIASVITKSLVYPIMHFNSDYWLALNYAKKALDALEELYPRRHQRHIENVQRDSFSNEEKMEYLMKKMRVKNFKVTGHIKANKINGVNTIYPEFEQIKAKKVMVTGRFLEPKQRSSFDEIKTEDFLNIENLELKGTFNDFQWEDLVNNTLKNKGVQFIKAPVAIRKLKAETVLVGSETISDNFVGKLVSITDGSFVVNQQIQFAAPLKAKNLQIRNRLNNIHVHKGAFDILLKRSNVTQVIEGAKNFDSLKVMEPITLSGKVAGQYLRSMLPVKAIHEPLTLIGNFSINNTLTIGKILKASDIILIKDKLSLLETLENGVTMDKLIDDVNLVFTSPLSANDSLISFINGVDMQNLIQTNIQDVQVIEGEKCFAKTLEIKKGFAEVKNLNGFNIEDLENDLLMKNTNQSIKVPFHLGIMVAKGLDFDNLSLNGKSLDKFLTRSGNQSIKSTLKVQNLRVHQMKATNFNTNGEIFGKNLQDIYQQKSKNLPHMEVFGKGQKFQGNLYIQNLYMNSSINGHDIQDIEKELSQLDGNIKYMGNYIFNHPMNVSRLTFNGSLNGLRKSVFGQCWLQKFGVQNFTASQTLAGVTAEKGILLLGKINSLQVEDFSRKTFSLEEAENLPNVIFEDPIEIQSSLRTRTLNNLFIPEDILMRNSLHPQKLGKAVTISRDLKVKNLIDKLSNINMLPLHHMENFMNDYGYSTLYLENASFTLAPNYKTLNHYNLGRCLNEIWLGNENIYIEHPLEIAEAHFDGLLELKGPVNDINLKYLRDNYLSLSEPQEVSSELVFMDRVNFNELVKVQNVFIEGFIVDTLSNANLNINDFATKTLKSSGNHIISGNWSLKEAYIMGDLQKVKINNKNLFNDVLRNDKILTELNIPKHLKQVKVDKLYATPKSQINRVNLWNWLSETVFLYENRTIYGLTSIDSVNVFNDLKVPSINNRTLDPSKLLQRDKFQIIQKDVIVENFLRNQKRFLTNNFENLNIEAINNKFVKDFLENVALKNSSLKIESPLKFEQSIYVDSLQEDEEYLPFLKLKRSQTNHLEDSIQDMKENPIKEPLNRETHDFHFIETSKLKESFIRKLFTNNKDEIFIVSSPENDTKTLQYMQWNWTKQIFEQTKDFDKIYKFDLESDRELSILSKYYPIVHSASQGKKNIIPLQINEKDCLALFGRKASTVQLYCFGENLPSTNKLELFKELPKKSITQVVVLDKERIALRSKYAVEIISLKDFETQKIFKFTGSIKDVQYSYHENKNLLAIVLANQGGDNTNPLWLIELYCCSPDSSRWSKIQSIPLNDLVKIAFTKDFLTKDLFMHTMHWTEDDQQIYSIYQYNATLIRFLPVADTILTLDPVKGMQALKQNRLNQDILAVVTDTQVFFVKSSAKES